MKARQDSPLMTAPEVGAAFRVDARTVSLWARAGKISCLTTPTGHRRYHRTEVNALLAGRPLSPAEVESMWAAHRNGGAR